MGASKPSVEKVDVFTPEQSATLQALNEATGGMINQMLAQLGYDIQGQPSYQQGIQALGTQLEAFDPAKVAANFEQYVAEPARTTFSEYTLPGIQERYSGRGSAGQVLSRDAAVTLEKALGAEKSNTLLSAENQKEQIRSNAINQALQFAQAPGQQGLAQLQSFLSALGISLQPQFQTGIQQGSSGILPYLLQAAGTAAGAYFGGPAGAAAGGAAGSAAGNAIG